MKKPAVDYRQLRLSNVTRPEYAHVLLLLGWVVYFALYFLTENLIPYDRCRVVHCPLDDRIPFCPVFVIPYLLWFVLVGWSLLYYFLYDVDSFRRLSVYIIVTQLAAMICYILWPSIQLLRPAEMPERTVFTRILELVYAFDTPTGVCPSLHTAYSLGILSVTWRRRQTPARMKFWLLVMVAVIIASTFLIKQHSLLDALAALPVCLLAEAVVAVLFGTRESSAFPRSVQSGPAPKKASARLRNRTDLP